MSEELRKLISREFREQKSQWEIPLTIPTYGPDEIMEALDSLLTTRVTMDRKVYSFEKMFADYIGVRNGIMLNSGSSANLIALSVLCNHALKNRIKPGDEVITPAVTWSTTVFPIINVGAVPVMADVGEDYLIDTDRMSELITSKTKAIMPVHLLGNPCDMKAINDIAEDRGLFVVEDCCEAHGAQIGNKKIGSFSDFSTFSFYFSHHINTIEGGITLTDSDELSDLAKTTRAHGWVREMKNREQITDKYPEIDPRFLFINMGYNLRPMEIQGAFGIHQLPKLEGFIEARRENSKYWIKELARFSDKFIIPEERSGTRHVWFGFPLTIREGAGFTRKQFTDFLAAKKIETRPVMAGNMCEQPAMEYFKHRNGELTNSKRIMRNSFFFGNHHGINVEKRRYVVDAITEFLERF